jgi:hypothetical protein
MSRIVIIISNLQIWHYVYCQETEIAISCLKSATKLTKHIHLRLEHHRILALVQERWWYVATEQMKALVMQSNE